MTDQPVLPQPGDLFANRYRIASLLGKGGFGAVYRARDTSLERDVAIKVLARAVGDASSLARFLQEAKAAASLSSEHVATVHEVGTTDDGPYIVMELLRGADLQDELDDRTRLPVPEAVDHVLQAALGIAHAHMRGIVHRDLKPRNLFLARRDDGTSVIKILDFGIAKSTATDLTQSGATLGTPQYMAPEQLRSARGVDARTDVWALGVVLYELTTGKPIFDDESATQMAVSIVVDAHIQLRARDATLPAELEAVIDRCLAKEPAERFADVHALALALAPLATDAGRALIPRIERALGDRASGVIGRNAATATAATVEVATPTDQATRKTPPSTRVSGDAPTEVVERAGAPTHRGGSRRDEQPGREDAAARADTAAHADAARPARADAPAPPARDDAPAPPARDAAAPPSDRDRGTDARTIVPGAASTGERTGTRSRRTTMIALVATGAVVLAVVMWQRGSSPTTGSSGSGSSVIASGSNAGSSAVASSSSASGSSAIGSNAGASGSGSSAVASGSNVGSSATGSSGSGGRVAAGSSAVGSGSARRPRGDVVARPAQPSDAEIEKIAGWCYDRNAPTFLVPGNDGPGSLQCGRMALLGCVGLASRCKTVPVTDDERKRCRDFQDSLRLAGICR